jgi:hypothetical protein
MRRAFDGLLVLLIIVVFVIAVRQATTKTTARKKGPTTSVPFVVPAAWEVKLTTCSYANYAATSRLIVRTTPLSARTMW